MLMRDEWLAGLRTQFDDASNVLTIRHDGKIAAEGDLATLKAGPPSKTSSPRLFPT